MSLTTFLELLKTNPSEVRFEDTMAIIDSNYEFTPTAFKNGGTYNEANTNNGSCKIFAFGIENELNEALTLACFGDYYRQDVLLNPTGEDHQNIRNFMKTGWDGVSFEAKPLIKK